MGIDHSNERISFRPGLRVVQRAEHIVLFSAGDARAARIPRAASPLLRLLEQGAQRSEMQRALQTAYPGDPTIAIKLDRFLFRLEEAGLLDSGGAGIENRGSWRRWNLLDIDPVARRCAQVLSALPRLPSNLLLTTLTAFSLAGIAAVLSASPHPDFQLLVANSSVWGIAFFFFFVVPIHEFAHAVACRAAGVPVLGMGLLFHGGIIPGPFVDTSSTYAVTDRWLRFRVPIVGPLVDLWAGGIAAWLLRLGSLSPHMHASVASVMFLSTIFFFLDTDPLLKTDGSRALEALLDDELARRAAFMKSGKTLSAKRVIWSYRFACVLYLCVVTILAVTLWTKDG